MTDEITRVPPHSKEAEISVLGSILLDPSTFGLIAGRLRAEDFYESRHKIIFQAMSTLSARAQPPDIQLLRELLLQEGTYDTAGGADYFMELMAVVPSPEVAEHYTKIVLEKALLRRLITVSHDIAMECYETSTPAEELLDKAQGRVFEITDRREVSRVKDMNQVLLEAMEVFTKFGGEYSGVLTQFSALNKYTNGFHSGELIILAARPRVGKTALALNMLNHIALRENKACAFFSLEMDAMQLVLRMLSINAQVDFSEMRRYSIPTPEVGARINVASENLRTSKIFIDDSSSITIHDIRAKLRRLKSNHGVEIAFIDYLSLITPDDRGRGDNRQEQVARMSRALKGIARELSMPVVCLAQLNRDIERRGAESSPRLADLRESGAIEQDADLVLFLHRRVAGDGAALTEEDERAARLIIAKQRNGPTGEIEMVFRGEFMRFENKSLEDDPPGYG